MKTRAKIGSLAVLLAAALVTGAQGASEERKGGSAFGFNGRTEVRELVLSWEPGAAELRIAAHLASGVTVTDKMKDADDVERLIRISQAFANPRARLAVDLERDAIVAFHLATGAGR